MDSTERGAIPSPTEKLTEAEWEQLARETFTLRKSDGGRLPDRRHATAPVWYPPGTVPVTVH